jgi:Hsp20/alpha crystallin family
VHGERKIEKEEKEENYRRVERQYGSFTRSFTLPSSVDTGQVRASKRPLRQWRAEDQLGQEGRSQAQADQGQRWQRQDPRSQDSPQGRVKPAVSEKTGGGFIASLFVCHL